MEEINIENKEQFEVRDLREKDKFVIDDKFLNGYAKFVGIYAVGIYSSLCRHANKKQKCWPSINKIAEELDIGKNSIIEGIKRLEFWQIIKKHRIGKMATNRYSLADKKRWLSISEVSLKDFSEVCQTNFRGLCDKLQRFARQTSNSKETQSKGNTIISMPVKTGRHPFSSKKQKVEKSPWSLSNYLSLMASDTNRHIQIIGVWVKEMELNPENKDQMKALMARNFRAARSLKGYSNLDILSTIRYLKEDVDYIDKFTLETISKYIDKIVADKKKSGPEPKGYKIIKTPQGEIAKPYF